MSKHLKAYAAPKSWIILRKVNKWITRPAPGAHEKQKAFPIGLLIKQLGFARTAREVKKILNDKNVSVDGKVIMDRHFSVGFMDAIQIKPSTLLRGKYDEKGRLVFVPMPKDESTKKVCKVIGKRTIAGGKLQLNLFDGRNVLVDKSDVAIGDSLVLELPSQKVIEHLPLGKGAVAFLLAGRHTGVIGTVESIDGDKIKCSKGKEQFETLKRFAFVLGKNKAVVKV